MLKDENNSIELKVLGYEFPNLKPGIFFEYDANWLQIEINVKHNTESWTAKDPALEGGDIVRLADWLFKIAKNKRTPKKMWFTENNIEIIRQTDGLDFILNSEFRKPNTKQKTVVPIKTKNEDVKKFAEDLLIQLRAFPLRGKIAPEFFTTYKDAVAILNGN